MTDSEKKTTEEKSVEEKPKDSLGIPLEKSPWTVFAALQIPLLVIMILVVYFLYQSRSNS